MSRSKKQKFIAGACFGLFGAMISGIVFFQSKDPVTLILLPGVAAFISGYFIGSKILMTSTLNQSIGNSLLMGVLTTLFAHLLFGIFYVIYLKITSANYTSMALGPIITFLGTMAMGIYTIPCGLISAFLLHLVSKKSNR